MELIPEFIKRRHGEVKIEYEHPLLEPIAKETYGILIYQEQVMQAAQALAGYTLGGADLFRRAMGKKKVEEMQKQREIFVKGCKEKNNIPPAKANQIFDLLEKFAGYGFNKSHAAAYAIVAYQTAYLKANYPVEFFCAMMTNDMANTEKLSEYIAEAREFDIEVLQPDVNESGMYFSPAVGRASPRAETANQGSSAASPHQHAIRFGLVAIKGVGEAAVEAILKARNENGKFKTLSELCERVDGRTLTRKPIEALIKTGACDSFGQTRSTLFAQIERTLSRAASILSDKQKGQSSLFGALEEKAPPMPEAISNLPEWPQHELLAHEKELLGFYVTGHPLTPFAPILTRYTLTNLAKLGELPNRSLTRIGGMISAVTHGFSKKSGKPYSMVTLEDLDGSVQLLVMNDYDKFRPLLEPNKALLVVGEISTGEDKPKIFPQEIEKTAARRRAEKCHEAGSSAPAHRALAAGGSGPRPVTRRRASGQMPAVAVLHASGRGNGFRGHERAVQRRAFLGTGTRGQQIVRRGNLLREGGHEPAGKNAAQLGKEKLVPARLARNDFSAP